MISIAHVTLPQITRVFICGLAFDFCVGYSALDAVDEGFETYGDVVVLDFSLISLSSDMPSSTVIFDACRSVAQDSKDDMISRLQQHGVRLIRSDQVAALVCAPP